MQAFNVEATREIYIGPYNYTLVIVQFRNIELSKILSRMPILYCSPRLSVSFLRNRNRTVLPRKGGESPFSLVVRRPAIFFTVKTKKAIGCFSFRAAKWRVARTYTHKFRSQGDFTISWEIRALIAAQSAAM